MLAIASKMAKVKYVWTEPTDTVQVVFLDINFIRFMLIFGSFDNQIIGTYNYIPAFGSTDSV